VPAPGAGDDLNQAYGLLLDGSPDGLRRLFDAAAVPLNRALRRAFPLRPDEEIRDGVHDALLAIIERPESYDPRQGSLLNLLVHIGRRRLVDRIRRWRRRDDREIGGVEVDDSMTNGTGELGREAVGRIVGEEVSALLEQILPDPRDREVFKLACDGRTAVDEFAAVLGIAHLPPEERKAQVKRERDRVMARVRRRREVFRELLLG